MQESYYGAWIKRRGRANIRVAGAALGLQVSPRPGNNVRPPLDEVAKDEAELRSMSMDLMMDAEGWQLEDEVLCDGSGK